MISDFSQIKESIKLQRPLIHCITSPVAINDCANAVLAVDAQPIMAEHPDEVAGITVTAKALTVSLANITDARMQSMMISGRAAWEHGIPSMIDCVGVACSPMRLALAKRFVEGCHPAVVKGNSTEIRALVGADYDSSAGTDAGRNDSTDSADLLKLVNQYALEHQTVVMLTGAVDLISDGHSLIHIHNGHELMSRVTGTGCVLTCITGVYLAVCDPLKSAVLAALNWDISGEYAAENAGPRLGSYHMALFDALSTLSGRELIERAHIVMR